MLGGIGEYLSELRKSCSIVKASNTSPVKVQVEIVIAPLKTNFKDTVPISTGLRSRISSKLIFASCVGYLDRAYYGFCRSSRMLILIEGNKIWQLWNSVSVRICIMSRGLRSGPGRCTTGVHWFKVLAEFRGTRVIYSRKFGEGSTRSAGLLNRIFWSMIQIPFWIVATLCKVECIRKVRKPFGHSSDTLWMFEHRIRGYL